MNTARKKRLVTIVTIAIMVSFMVFFALRALNENINVFYAPTDIKQKAVLPTATIRLGGMVEKGSVVRSQATDLAVRFFITDFNNRIEVSYQGILPDLFSEGQGVVVIGQLKDKEHFRAKQVLAKHDENYMPPEVAALTQKNKKR